MNLATLKGHISAGTLIKKNFRVRTKKFEIQKKIVGAGFSQGEGQKSVKNEKKAKNGKSKKIMSRLRGGGQFFYYFF